MPLCEMLMMIFLYIYIPQVLDPCDEFAHISFVRIFVYARIVLYMSIAALSVHSHTGYVSTKERGKIK